MTEPIRGKVARVLNAREIAINIGTAKGVTVGMRFNVLDAREQDIIDPETNEVLGSIERPKARVEVTHAQETLSVAATYQAEQVNIGGTGDERYFDVSGSIIRALTLGPFARSLMPPNWITKYETLRKTRSTPDPLDEEDSLVKIGDSVVQVLETGEAEEDTVNGK